MIPLLSALENLQLESIISKQIDFHFSRVNNNAIFTFDTLKTERNFSQFLVIPSFLFERHTGKMATYIANWQIKV